jgi:hypothetical protein
LLPITGGGCAFDHYLQYMSASMAAAGKVEGGGAACGGASPGCTAGDCPSCGHEYDCRERVPVRSTCTCGRLVCKSCEGAWVREGAARMIVGCVARGRRRPPMSRLMLAPLRLTPRWTRGSWPPWPYCPPKLRGVCACGCGVESGWVRGERAWGSQVTPRNHVASRQCGQFALLTTL